MADDEVIEVEEADEIGLIVMMLGLYLIVLAFFILLNAISESSEEKVEKVSESISEGFGFQLSGPMNMRDDIEVTVNPVFDIIAQEIQSVLESYISDNQFKFATNANQMVLKIETRRIFSPGSIRIRPAMAYFFEDVAKIVSTKRPGTRLVSDVIVRNNDRDIGTTKLPVMELAGRRAALFVRALIERGVDQKYISAGAEYHDESEIEILFEIVVTDTQKATRGARERSSSDGSNRSGPQVPDAYPERKSSNVRSAN